ncbi:MAG: ABC transporter substrate-binding protein [Lachnospiraceae bacterium]|nr:ABC transporter substrate-binding protein [Lachnospiraceae bacterium]
MKKIIALLLASVMLFASACSNKAAQQANEPTGTPSSTVKATDAPTAAPTKAPEPTAEPTPEPTDVPLPETRTFTDSVGREVEIPYTLEKVAVSGPLAQIVLFALCPDKLAGIAGEWDKTAEKYLATEYYNLPVLGQLYGGKGELNLETLLNSGAQVVIDVGEPKKTIAEDLDGLQAQTGIPFVHVTATISTMGDAYRKLGELLGMQDEAEALAVYCENVYSRTLEIADSAEKRNLLYIAGDQGLNVIANGSYHAEVIDLLSNNLAVVDSPSSKGTGNEVDMEQILLWNPDVILFAPGSIYSSVKDMPEWQAVKAVQTGEYYEVPFGPYNWMGFPPSAQRLLGMMWMSKLLYPEKAGYDLYDEVREYYRLFYHADLTKEQYEELIGNSILARPDAAAPAA